MTLPVVGGRIERMRDEYCIVDFPQTHIKARFLSLIDRMGRDDR